MNDEAWMKKALELAGEAAEIGEVPVGAVIVRDREIISESSNLREKSHNPVAHAEILAIQQAAAKLGAWRLEDCTLYVTLEPCPMCAGAIVNSRIPRLVYGATDPKAGAVNSLYQITQDARLNHQVEVVGGVLAEDCGKILSEFFRNLRQQKS
jgi:tRNA(adenine34) deaminase